MKIPQGKDPDWETSGGIRSGKRRFVKGFPRTFADSAFQSAGCSAGLLVVVSSPRPRDLVAAQAQIREILDIAERWDPLFLNNLADPGLKEAKLDSATMPCTTIEWTGHADGSKLTLGFDRPA